MIADVMHFSFTVSDIDRAVAWYTDVLGLELVHRQRQDNEYTRALVGIPDAVLEVAQLKLTSLSPAYSTHVLELIEYSSGGVARVESLPTSRVGTAHLALLVTDIDDRYQRMCAAGTEFVSEPVEITAGANKGGKACYLRDPDGITLELLQAAPQRAHDIGLAQ